MYTFGFIKDEIHFLFTCPPYFDLKYMIVHLMRHIRIATECKCYVCVSDHLPAGIPNHLLEEWIAWSRMYYLQAVVIQPEYCWHWLSITNITQWPFIWLIMFHSCTLIAKEISWSGLRHCYHSLMKYVA